MARPRNDAIPAELTAAALALFVDKGFAATRLDDVAARAGVSKGTVYLHFRSKDELFKAVIRESIVPALEEGEALAAAHAGDASSLLRQMLGCWWRLIGGTALAGVSKLMISEARNFPEVAQFYEAQVIQRCRGLLAEVLERGMASGEFRRLDVGLAIDVIVAPLLMRAIWRYSFGACAAAPTRPAAGDEAQAFLDLHFDLLISGLAKEPA